MKESFDLVGDGCDEDPAVHDEAEELGARALLGGDADDGDGAVGVEGEDGAAGEAAEVWV